MGRMTWDIATLQYYCWDGRACREADSDYGADTPRRTLWTCRVASEVLPRRSRYTRVNRSHEQVAGDCT